MAGKVAYISINDVVNAYTSEEITALEANPPEEILTERASIENRQRQYDYFRNMLLGEISPATKALCISWLASHNEIYEKQLVMEQLPIEGMRWCLDMLYRHFMRNRETAIGREAQVCYAVQKEVEQIFDSIRQDEKDIASIRERLSNRIKAEAQWKVRQAVIQLCADESYDMIFDAATLVAIGIEADNVGAKVLAKLNQG